MDKNLFNANKCLIVEKDYRGRVRRMSQEEWLKSSINGSPSQTKQKWMYDYAELGKTPIYDFEALWYDPAKQISQMTGMHRVRKFRKQDIDTVLVITDWYGFYENEWALIDLLKCKWGDWLLNDEPIDIEKALNIGLANLGKWKPYYRSSILNTDFSLPDYWICPDAKLECPDIWERQAEAKDKLFEYGLNADLTNSQIINKQNADRDPYLPFNIYQ